MLPESLCDVTSGLMASLSILSPPPAPPLPKVRDSCRLIFLILSISGGREGGGGCDAEGGGAASLETAPGQVEQRARDGSVVALRQVVQVQLPAWGRHTDAPHWSHQQRNYILITQPCLYKHVVIIY